MQKRNEKHVIKMEGPKVSILEKYVKREREDNFVVNWSTLENDYISFLRKDPKGLTSIDYMEILEYLAIKGVLQYGRKSGTFFIICDDHDISPNPYGSHMSFTKKADAESYKEAKSQHHSRQVYVCQNIS